MLAEQHLNDVHLHFITLQCCLNPVFEGGMGCIDFTEAWLDVSKCTALPVIYFIYLVPYLE